MKTSNAAVIGCLILTFLGSAAFAQQQQLVNDARKKELTDLSVQQNDTYVAGHQKAISLAPARGWTITRKTKDGGRVSLQGVNSLGFPIYLTTHNLASAQTTQTPAVRPGGSLGLNLTGSSTFLKNKLAIWDGGSVYAAHQEFTGKTITLKDPSSGVIDHATHVSGTMIARGAYPPAQGMAYGATSLISYDFDNDVSKMSAAAANLLLSNHSYGDEAGWDFNTADSRWEWYGLPGDSVDYTFGFYDPRAQAFDQIAYKAPYYLIVESAGNAHAYPGPSVGSDYYGYNSRTDQTMVDKGPRPATISSNNGFKVISTTGNAKDILTVGAINSLPNGPSSANPPSIGYFSSYGPTDDGRIKPDIVGMGVSVVSCGSGSPDQYITESGTSMSAPNVTGSLLLLQEYYAELHSGNFMRAATLKGLACGTAYDAGNAGPDYIYGWGLLDMKTAAQALTDDGTKSIIKESALQQSQTQTLSVVASGKEPLIATISWTDPAGTPSADGTLNDQSIKLVNDLDIRVSDGSTTFKPWVLDPANPGAAATTGDNIRDNIEQVMIANAEAGKTYTITISNKGTLQGGSQNYSLIATGLQAVGSSTGTGGGDIGLNVYPVPANTLLNVAFDITTAKALDLSLVNSAGQVVYSNKTSLKAGSFNFGLDVTNQPPGVYAVRMFLSGKLYSRKIIIMK